MVRRPGDFQNNVQVEMTLDGLLAGCDGGEMRIFFRAGDQSQVAVRDGQVFVTGNGSHHRDTAMAFDRLA